jgi:hypothetical protein
MRGLVGTPEGVPFPIPWFADFILRHEGWKFLLTPVLMEVDTGSFDFAGRIAGRDSDCFAQDDNVLGFGLLRSG